MNKTLKVLEIVWLFVGCMCVLMCAYMAFSGLMKDSVFFLVATFACGLMYAVRRKQRLKHEAYEKEKGQKHR